MTILDEIGAQKRHEVAKRKQEISIAELEKRPLFTSTPISLTASLTANGSTGIIAEFKRRSPSKGMLHEGADSSLITAAYTSHGAAGLSVLTETAYFSGSDDDLLAARKNLAIPILRKDFMVDEFQLVEARSLGADVILLIAAMLEPAELISFGKLARELGMQILLEVHSREELERSLNPYIDIVGINNRNLKDFTVSVRTSYELGPLVPSEFLKISESAITDITILKNLKAAGFNGFLIGETFMKEKDPGLAFADFVTSMKALA